MFGLADHPLGGATDSLVRVSAWVKSSGTFFFVPMVTVSSELRGTPDLPARAFPLDWGRFVSSGLRCGRLHISQSATNSWNLECRPSKQSLIIPLTTPGQTVGLAYWLIGIEGKTNGSDSGGSALLTIPSSCGRVRNCSKTPILGRCD